MSGISRQVNVNFPLSGSSIRPPAGPPATATAPRSKQPQNHLRVSMFFPFAVLAAAPNRPHRKVLVQLKIESIAAAFLHLGFQLGFEVVLGWNPLLDGGVGQVGV